MEQDKKKELFGALGEALKEVFNKNQDRPDQYVVAYYRVSDDSLIGYHASTFCQVTKDILNGKRYSGENPYSQLQTISKNLKYTLSEKSSDGFFGSIHKKIRNEDFEGLSAEEVYMDAIYLAEGTPKQSFKMLIIDPNEDDKSDKL